MNTAEDIKRMLGELVDEAIRIGRAEGEKTLGTEFALKEQVQRLTDDKRKLVQNLDHVIEENNDLELTIGRLKATIEKTENENANKQARLDSYQKVWVSQGKEINQLTEQVHQLEAENQEMTDRLKEAERKNTCLSAECDLLDATAGNLRKKLDEAEAKIREQNEALAIYRVPTPRDCPFCGGPAEVHQLRKGEWYVACGNDSCPVNPETSCFDTETDAIEAWNNSYNAPKVTCDWR